VSVATLETLGATEERVAQGGWHEDASIENNRKVRCHRSNWAPLFGQGKIVVRSVGNFFFGDSLNGSFLFGPYPLIARRLKKELCTTPLGTKNQTKDW
jgi:hypothetical protein